MATSDISSGLTFGVLAPAPAVRGAGADAGKQDSHGPAHRRRSGGEDEENPELPETCGEDQHQIDDLA